MPTRIYEYGLLPPDVNSDLVFEQMRLAPRYYNRLIEIERERRTRVRAALASHPDVAQIDADVKQLSVDREQLRDKIKVHRSTTRSRKAPDELALAVKELSAALKIRRAELKAAKGVIASDVEVTRAIADHSAWAADRVREARAASKMYWGNYLIVEQAVDAARKSKMDPKFRPFTGDGRVSAQLQGGISVEELYGSDTQVQIVTRSDTDPALEAQIAAKVSERADLRARWKAGGDRGYLLAARALSKEIYGLRTRNVGYRRDSQRSSLHGHEVTFARLRLRVQSDVKGGPVWAEWPMMLDRPLPKGARIKVVTVQKRRRDSASHEWRAHIMLDVTDCQLGQPGEGACALNLGWCQKTSGDLRAGYVVGSDGFEKEVTLPRSIIERVEKSESIQGYRDQDRDALLAQLGPWIAQRRETAPAWFQERVKTLHAWKSQRRFAGLAHAWRQARQKRETGESYGGRWDGDAEGYQILDAWHRRDRHLEQYQAGLRRGAHRHRRDIYRCVAKELADRYRTLVIDDTDLRDFQRDPKPEDKREKIDVVARNQGHVSPHELRLALVSAFTRAGKIDKRSAVDVTRKHATCGSIEDWDRAQSVREHTCSVCGETYDQDANACKNLLHEHLGAADGGGGARVDEIPVTKKESRSDRLRKSRWKVREGEPLAT